MRSQRQILEQQPAAGDRDDRAELSIRERPTRPWPAGSAEFLTGETIVLSGGDHAPTAIDPARGHSRPMEVVPSAATRR